MKTTFWFISALDLLAEMFIPTTFSTMESGVVPASLEMVAVSVYVPGTVGLHVIEVEVLDGWRQTVPPA